MVTGLDVQNLRVQARVNGQTRQDGKHQRHDFPGGDAGVVHLAHHDPAARRPGHHRHAQRVGPIATATWWRSRSRRRHLEEPGQAAVTRAYVGLGSNPGDRRAHLDAAVAKLGGHPGVDVPRDGGAAGAGRRVPQPAYLNAVAEVETALEPHALLARLREIEQAEGRPAQRERWQPRTLDLDLLLYGDRVIDSPELKVPHPELHRRRFVLEPLCELAPDAVHPQLKITVRELLAQLMLRGL
ncbi:MAG: 2-amino-4-hydroxy-6-hydroxymethyldihydropteridine diphosphokinase [Archangiaceae bacterium]|nr:2-amino-4-hydroxy-6-hydroxymethyldihydropteridine diphosphokinase [Archangiaceae bacterium]